VALPASHSSPYTKEGIARELRQSEIITDVLQFTYKPIENLAEERLHRHTIILSQDCDLLWDYEARARGEPGDLNGVLVYELEPASEMRAKVPQGRDIWKRLIQNKDERYHYLVEIPKLYDTLKEGLPSLIIDFKRFFTLAPEEIYRQVALPNGAKRRCRLEVPFREHLQSRAAYYLQRVGLPLV
jgi:hypothetical protein